MCPPEINNAEKTKVIQKDKTFDTVQEAKTKDEEQVNDTVTASQNSGESANEQVASFEEDVIVEVRDEGGVLISIVKTVLYITFVLGVAVFLAVMGIKIANDVFAFVKDDREVQIMIGENATISDVAEILAENEVIDMPDVFKFYVEYKYRNKNLVIVPGTYTVNSQMNYDEIVYVIKKKAPPRQEVVIMIPEGLTVDETIDLFLENGIGTREGFIDAIQNYDYKYKFMDVLNSLELGEGRKYRLEGYLFPDTYNFYTDTSEIGIIDKLLSNFEYYFEVKNYARCEELGMTMDEVITLASMIEKEAKVPSDYYVISSVFHNRLKSNTLKKLESDATIQYFLPERKEELSQSDLNTDNPYNTYLYQGLPPSAIANPGIDSIYAALYPDETDYYYFVADTTGKALDLKGAPTGIRGKTLFARTHAEHLRNKQSVENAKKAEKQAA